MYEGREPISVRDFHCEFCKEVIGQRAVGIIRNEDGDITAYHIECIHTHILKMMSGNDKDRHELLIPLVTEYLNDILRMMNKKQNCK